MQPVPINPRLRSFDALLTETREVVATLRAVRIPGPYVLDCAPHQRSMVEEIVAEMDDVVGVR